MSEHTLPEDMSLWPNDPFALLGVRDGTTPRDLKRNYVRLIKTYKPEHFPDQFRRIREAYEFILRFVEQALNSARTAAPDHSTLEPSEAEQVRPATFEGTSSRTDPTRREYTGAALAPRARDIDLLWDRAITGDEAGAYAGYLRLRHDSPAESRILIRLYWLVALNADLDPQRDPREWLAEAICVSDADRSALELYRHEVEAFPGEALTPRFERILHRAASPEQYVELMAWRTRGLAESGDWDSLATDLIEIRERLQHSHEALYLRYLVQVLGRLTWSQDSRTARLWDSCLWEIRALEYLATPHQELFDRVDYLVAVRTLIADVPARIRELLVDGALLAFPDVEPKLQSLLAEIDCDPLPWLDQFDQTHRSASMLLGEFGLLLQSFESYYALKVQPKNLTAAAPLVPALVAGSDYSAVRHAIVDLARSDAIAPEWVAQVIERGLLAGVARDHPFVHFLNSDLPLRLVCWARRLAWA